VNQSASDFRAFSINRFAAPKQKFSAKPARDRKAPFKFRFAGKLKLPAGVTAAQACKSGTITAQTKSVRGKTYSSRRTKIRKNCSYGVNLTFKNKRRLGNGKLKVRLRFSGNAVMKAFSTSFRNIRVG
jgi:hypothetical protein